MKCPVCDEVVLREIVKNDVLIDVCPSCKGVWLDRGELDKLMNSVHATHQEYDQLQSYAYDQRRKSQQPISSYDSYSPSGSGYPGQAYPPKNQYHHNHYKKVGYDKYGRPYPYKKKKSVFNILEDLFD